MSAAPGVPQAGNKLDIPVNSYSTLKESLGACPEFTFDPKERTSGPFHSLTSTTTRPLPASAGHSSTAGFFGPLRGYDVTISRRSKYSPISVGAILNIDRYLGMPIPITQQFKRSWKNPNVQIIGIGEEF